MGQAQTGTGKTAAFLLATFHTLLSKSKKMLNFDKESIKVIKGDSTGAINATGTLTIVGLTDEFS